MMKLKKFKLDKSEIKKVLDWDGPSGCIATDKIVVEGFKIGYMYREVPNKNYPDSGWRFFQGEETDDYIKDIKNSGIYDLNTICNYDPSIIPLLNSPYNTAYYRDKMETFRGEKLKDSDK